MEKEIEKAIRETLVIENKQSVKYAVKRILRLFSVVGRSEQLLEEQSNWLMANTSLEVEKIVDFKEQFK